MNVGLVAAAGSGLATSLGALPFVFVRSIPRRAYDGILGLGAGLMLAAATLGLLSEAVHGVRTAEGLDVGRLALVIAGFLVGVALAAVMDRFIPHHHAGGHHEHLGHAPGHDVHDRHHDEHEPGEARRGYAVVGALTLHRLPEGLAIGAGFAVPGESHLGMLLAIAVGVQNACEGLVMAAPLRQGGVSGRRGFLLVAATGLVIPGAAVLGDALAGLATAAMPFILALAGGTLIYITSNEIIPESHSHGHEGTASAGLVAGFMLTMVLQAVLH
ncbi:MAG TPA: ZIP family metal transporter [Polyangia bacterium]|nr:ZIP family metal transporter [Polyangia bacterium]